MTTLPRFFQTLLEENYHTPDMADISLHEEHYLFVYGNSKSQQARHCYLEDENYVGRAYTKYATYGILNYNHGRTKIPYAYTKGLDAAPAFILGELYVISPEKLAYLDFIESNTLLCERKCTHVVVGRDYRETIAWMYMIHPDVLSKADNLFKYENYSKRSHLIWNTPVIDWTP